MRHPSGKKKSPSENSTRSIPEDGLDPELVLDKVNQEALPAKGDLNPGGWMPPRGDRKFRAGRR